MAAMQVANTDYQIIKCIAQLQLNQTKWVMWSHYLTNNTRVGIVFLKIFWAQVCDSLLTSSAIQTVCNSAI